MPINHELCRAKARLLSARARQVHTAKGADRDENKPDDLALRNLAIHLPPLTKPLHRSWRQVGV
jgi:hypothetical protein